MLQKYTTPRWLAAHLIVIIVAGVFIRLGIWQLDRLEERRSQNETIAQRTEIAPVSSQRIARERPGVRTRIPLGRRDRNV